MEYLVIIPFVTAERAYTTGEIVTDVQDANNLIAGGLIEPLIDETPAEHAPKPKKASKK